ncbi:MAG: hypothetical protein M5R36_00980 [Deltaproteobacteria bacterium]|nr:hypothetical protein [Deltaproteobacteria bacterium]
MTAFFNTSRAPALIMRASGVSRSGGRTSTSRESPMFFMARAAAPILPPLRGSTRQIATFSESSRRVICCRSGR